MANRKPIEIDEWYHCYNRGVDKRRVFQNSRDYERMLGSMFLAKNSQPIRLFSLADTRLASLLQREISGKVIPMVEIGAYVLMPNHVHFVLKEVQEGGISLFMQKVFTAYTMYFNEKNKRVGALFAGTFKSKHILDDRYLQHLVAYVHLNPGELFQPHWKSGKCDVAQMENDLRKYRYSSLPDFLSDGRSEKALLGKSIFELFDETPSMRRMIRDAQTYETLQFDENE